MVLPLDSIAKGQVADRQVAQVVFHPHTDPDASDDDLRRIADEIAGYIESGELRFVVLGEAGAELAFSYQGEAFGKRVAPLATSLGSDLLVDMDVTDDASLDAILRPDVVLNTQGIEFWLDHRR